MKTIKAWELKAKCLAIMDEVAATGEPVLIIRNGKAVCQLVPCRQPLTSLFVLHRDTIRIHGDIMSPLTLDWATDG